MQSQFIEINGQNYAVVGQQTLGSFLFSHYDVFDTSCGRADEEKAATIYHYISKFQMTEVLERMIELLEDVADEPPFDHEEFAEKYGEDVAALQRENKEIRSLLHQLVYEKGMISNIEVWKVDDFQRLTEKWNAFWDVYEQRLKKLFILREYIWEHNLNVAIQETNVRNLYVEANAMYSFFSDSLSTERPVVTNIDDLIEIVGELGRVPSYGDQTRYLTPFERFSMHFFKMGYRAFLFGAVPLALIGMFVGNISFRTVVILLFIATTLFTAHTTDTLGRRTKIMRRFKKARKKQMATHPLMRTQYATAYETVKAREQTAVESSYQFKATPTIVWRSMVILGTIMFIIGLGILGANEASYNYGYGWITVASILLLLRFILPFTRFANVRFQLTPDGLKRGKKRETYLRNILELNVNKRGSMFSIDIGMQHNQKFTIKKAYRRETIKQLEIWSDKHSLNYKTRLFL